MTKGERSKQRLIECAAELFWKNGYSATGVSEILNHAGLHKGLFYFYFKSKDELAIAAISCYREKLLDKLETFSTDRNWKDFLEDVFAYLENQSADPALWGCPCAVMGMDLALQKADIAQSDLDGIKQLQALFHRVLLQSGLSQPHADVLSERLAAVYQGNLLPGRIGQDRARLKHAKESMIQVYKEYRALYAA